MPDATKPVTARVMVAGSGMTGSRGVVERAKLSSSYAALPVPCASLKTVLISCPQPLPKFLVVMGIEVLGVEMAPL